MSDIRLIVADPGHFHAALVQKEMDPNLSAEVHVYAPVGPDLADYLARIARFNTRSERPTRWQLEIHAAPDFFERMCAERPGAAAIFSGRNHGKINGSAPRSGRLRCARRQASVISARTGARGRAECCR
jgi:hypothetical protein